MGIPTSPLRVQGLVSYKKPPKAQPPPLPGMPTTPNVPLPSSGTTMPTSSPIPPTSPANKAFDPVTSMLNGGSGMHPRLGAEPAPGTVAGLFSVPGKQNTTEAPATAPKVDPVSGLPVQPAGAPKQTMTSAVPVPTGVEAPAPKQVHTLSPEAAPKLVEEAPQPKQTMTLAPEAAPKLVEDTPPSKAPPMPTADNDLETLRNAAVNALTATEDPVAKREFNRAVMKIGMANQAARDALKMQISQDPALANQPAGTAVLMEAARDSAFKLDDIIAGLSVESAKRIQELNEWGFDNLAKITEYRHARSDSARKEMLDAGDYDGYADAFKRDTGLDVDVDELKKQSPATQNAINTQVGLMNKALAAGNVEAARKYFDAIVALAPDAYAGANFDDLGFADDSYLMNSQVNQDIAASVRLQVTQGDTKGALAGIERLQPDKLKRETAGAKSVESMELADINRALQAAGMGTVSDKTELIGRADDVYKALEMAKITGEAGSTVVDKGVSMLQGELQKLGYDPTKPEEAKALRSYVLNLQLNGGLKVGADGSISLDPNSIIPPWDPRSVDSHLFSDWPVLDANGNPMAGDRGWEPYGDDNPRPTPDSARGQYYESLDKKWEDYLVQTPAANRLTRDAWFHATKAGTQKPDEKLIPGGLVEPNPTEDASDPLVQDAILQKVRTGETLEPADNEALIKSGRLTSYSPKDLVSKNLGTLANENDGLVLVNGHVVQIKPGQGGEFTFFKRGSLAPVIVRYIPVTIENKPYYMDSAGHFYLEKPKDKGPGQASLSGNVDPWAKATTTGTGATK